MAKKTSASKEGKKDIMRFAGAMKNQRKKLEELNALIAAEREANFERTFEESK